MKRKREKFDSLTIEIRDDQRNPYAVYGHGIYEDWSVLAGEDKRVFLDSFPTLSEARDAFPGAVEVGGSTKREYTPSDVPPPWFDPTLAGEAW